MKVALLTNEYRPEIIEINDERPEMLSLSVGWDVIDEVSPGAGFGRPFTVIGSTYDKEIVKPIPPLRVMGSLPQ